MRNSFIYYGIGQSNLLNALLNMSKDIDYISILTSNITKKATDLPKDYINYNILAGVGKNSGIISNKNSFEKLYDFHTLHKDWLFGYLSYDIKNELEELSSLVCWLSSAENSFSTAAVFDISGGRSTY